MHGNGQWSDLIGDFCEFSRTLPGTDIYRLWCGISMVAGALERRVWLNVRSRPTYPNLYVLLVGPPGTGKSLIEDVKKFWRDTIEVGTHDSPAFHVAADSVTKASLIDEIDDAVSVRIKGVTVGQFKYQSLLVAAEEFEVLLPHYDPEFIATLNSIYNNKEFHSEKRRTGNHRVVELTNPQINLLGGVQPSYFVAHFPDYAWTTGLIRRIIMVYSEEGSRLSLLTADSNTGQLRKHILQRLSQISDLYGPAKISNDALGKLDDWHMAGGPPRPDHSRLQNYVTSRTEFVMKLSIVSAVSRNYEPIVQSVDINRAIEWLIEVERRMPDVFRAMRGQSDDLILDILHQFVSREYIKGGKQGVPTSKIVTFLAHATTLEKIPKIMETAEIAEYMEGINGGRDLWRPLPKHLHGIE